MYAKFQIVPVTERKNNRERAPLFQNLNIEFYATRRSVAARRCACYIFFLGKTHQNKKLLLNKQLPEMHNNRGKNQYTYGQVLKKSNGDLPADGNSL